MQRRSGGATRLNKNRERVALSRRGHAPQTKGAAADAALLESSDVMWIWSAMARAKEFEKEQDEEAKDALDVRTSLGNGDHLEEKDWQNLSSDEAAVLEALDYMIILNRRNTKAEHENEIGA